MPPDRTTALQRARRTAIAVLGCSVLLLAAVLFFTPVPAFLIFLVGLAILASEFVWAATLLQRVKSIRKKSSVAGDQSSVSEVSEMTTDN